MTKYIVEFTLTGEGMINADTEEEAHEIIKKSLEKSACVIGEELADSSELVHVSAKHLHTLSVIKERDENTTEGGEGAGAAEGQENDCSAELEDEKRPAVVEES